MELLNNAYSGAAAAIFAALLWAIASSIFERVGKKIVPVELNLIKGFLALLFVILSLLISGEELSNLDLHSAVLLAISGVVGIGIGDTAYFRALDLLGARRALLITMLAPAITSVIAMLFLGENLSLMAWIGIAVTIAGIAWVISEQAGSNGQEHRFIVQGILFALIAALGQSVGAVLSRAVLSQTTVSPMQSNLLRLSAGSVALLIWIAASRVRLGGWLKVERTRRTMMQVVSATFLGTFLGMWLQQVAFKFSEVGIAQTLSSTSPLFILPISWLSGEKISLRAVLGALAATIGIILLFTA